jgi:cytoskeleton protein RodZ
MMDTSDVAANAKNEFVSPQQPALNVGKALCEARERLGMSVHDVAERIKFAPKQVEALEANDFSHLPQATFLRGFVRSYARVLHLDEVALIAALPTEPARQVAAKVQTVDVAFPTMQSLRRINVLWLAGALGVALVLGLFVLLHEGEPTAKTAQVVVEPLPLPTSEMAVSAVVDTEIQPKTAEVVQVAEPKKITEPVKARQPVMKPAPQIDAASAPVAAAKQSIPLEALKRRPLHLVFKESSWAEVIDAHGAVLLSRNNPRGSEKWVGGPRHAPYDISIAHPANVKLYFRGKEIDLSAYAGMDVVHLKVE